MHGFAQQFPERPAQGSLAQRLSLSLGRRLGSPQVLDDGIEDFWQIVAQRLRVQVPGRGQQRPAEVLRRGNDLFRVRFDEGSQAHRLTSIPRRLALRVPYGIKDAN
jgi:hypothetical protein